MATLPSAGSDSTVGVLISTKADDGAIKTTQAELTVLGETAEKSGSKAASSFENFNKNLKNVGQQMTDVGRSMTTYVSLPIIGVAAASTKMAMQFQQDMELLVTNAGLPQSAIKGLSNSVLDMAAQVGQKPDDLAKAFFHIATAGAGIFSTAQMLDQLKIAAQGAAIGQANLDDTTYALTSTLAANIKGAENTSQAMGTLLGIVQAGDMHLSDLNEVISTGLMGTLSTFGVSLQSAGAALADFGDLGEKGAAAGTRLRMMLTLMTSPSQAAAKVLGDLGLATNEVNASTGAMSEVFAKTGLTTTRLANDLRQPNGISVAIRDLQQHLEDAGLTVGQTDAILSKAFGGGKSDAALMQLLNTTDRLDLKYKQIGQDTNKFADNWKAQQQQAKQQWNQAWDGIQSDMIKLGVAIMPQVTHAMNDVGKAVSGVSGWFQGLSKGQKQFVIDAAAVIAAAGPVLLVFGTMARSISSIITLATGPFGQAMLLMAKVALNAADQIVASMTGGTGIRAAIQSVQAATGASGLAMAGVLAGVAADAYLVVKAVQAVKGAFDDMNAAAKSSQNAVNAKNQEYSTLQNLMTHGTPAQQLRASTIYRQDFGSGFASGTNYAREGWHPVGENGPEMMYVPQGSMVKTNAQSSMTNNSQTTTISIGQVVLASDSAVTEFFKHIDRDTQLQSMGLSPARGIS